MFQQKMNGIIQRVKKDQFINDSFWALFGNIIAKGLGLLGAILVARYLGKETFGEYGTIRNTVINIAIFSSFGLGYTATKFIAENKDSSAEFLKSIIFYTVGISLVLSVIMSVTLFFTSEYISEHLLNAPHLSSSLKLLTIWVVFNSITISQIGILAGFGRFKEMAKINTYVGLTMFITSVVFTYFWGLNGAFFALIVTQIINWYFNMVEVRKLIPSNTKLIKNRPFFIKIFKFSFPVALQEALYSITTWLIVIIIIKLSNYSEVGLYSAAMQWVLIILFIPGILRNVILNHMAKSNSDESQHNKLLKRTILFNFLITIIPAVFVFPFRNIIADIYGASFKEDLPQVLTLALFSTVFISMGDVYSQAYMSKGQNWLMFSFKFFRNILILITSYFLMKNHFFAGSVAILSTTLVINVFFLMIISLIYHKVIDN